MMVLKLKQACCLRSSFFGTSALSPTQFLLALILSWGPPGWGRALSQGFSGPKALRMRTGEEEFPVFLLFFFAFGLLLCLTRAWPPTTNHREGERVTPQISLCICTSARHGPPPPFPLPYLPRFFTFCASLSALSFWPSGCGLFRSPFPLCFVSWVVGWGGAAFCRPLMSCIFLSVLRLGKHGIPLQHPSHETGDALRINGQYGDPVPTTLL